MASKSSRLEKKPMARRDSVLDRVASALANCASTNVVKTMLCHGPVGSLRQYGGLRAGDAHCQTDIRRFVRGGIVEPVAGHRNDLPLALRWRLLRQDGDERSPDQRAFIHDLTTVQGWPKSAR